MKVAELPLGANPEALTYKHFPTRWQAVLWRNWGMVPLKHLETVLKTDAGTLLDAAEKLGLPPLSSVSPIWLERGYTTVIRKNWHLLPYQQLLQLLGWDAEQLAFTLKEDDFLWHKLGDLKPKSDLVFYAPLTPEQAEHTAEIKKYLKKYFPGENQLPGPGFDFLTRFQKPQTTERSKPALKTADDEIIIDNSWNIFLPPAAGNHLKFYLTRWLSRLDSVFGLRLNQKEADSKLITLTVKPQKSSQPESHSIAVFADRVTIEAVDEVGIMRALTWLETEMERRNAPILPKGNVVRQTRFVWRCVYPYHLLYGDPLSDPAFTPPPEGLLEEYAKLGINGIWLQAVLYKLAPIPGAPEFSAGFKERLAKLRVLTEKAANYGIGVYLYLNEPRNMPLAFFDKFPDWRGELHMNGLWAGMCTSNPAVREHLRASVTSVFTEVPGLAGAFLITMSENLSNCYSKCMFPPPGRKPDCPLCGKREPEDVVGEVNRTIAESIFAVNPQARVLAWTWGWRALEREKMMPLLAPGTTLMCNSEEAMPIEIGGVKLTVSDYTISNPGPGELSMRTWELADKQGLLTAAKVQLNNSWECPAIPFLPASYLVREHLDNLTRQPVTGLLLSWTLGGYPSFNLLLASQYYWHDPAKPFTGDRLDCLIDKEFGPAAPEMNQAIACFSTAFREFPFQLRVLYVGPQNPGPANLLYEKPSGYRPTMVGFPYDALEVWRGDYPAAVFEEQFKKLSVKWREGLPLLEKAKAKAPPHSLPLLLNIERMAWSTWLHFRSSYLQTAYIRERDKLLASDADPESSLQKIRAILQEEISLARRLAEIAAEDGTIGFEATNQYAYTLQDLWEKVLNCEWLLKYFAEFGKKQ